MTTHTLARSWKRAQPRRAGTPASSLLRTSPMFDAVDVVPAPLTHYVEYDRIQQRGDSIALCNNWVARWHISGEPTCPECQQALRLTAAEVFGDDEVIR